MSHPQTAALRHLDRVDPALGQQARAVLRRTRSIRQVYALAEAWRPGLGGEVRFVYVSAQRAAYHDARARRDGLIAAQRARGRME